MPLARSASISAGGIHREWATPRGSAWARIEITLLIFATIQMFTSIYIYLDRRHDFFFFYLGYATISWMLMLFRVRYGLVWFALGSMLYCIWLSILTWRAVTASNYVEVCLDFVLAAFELLVLCLSLARFHEVGGLAPCCGEPDHLGKEAAFRVGVKNNARAVIASGPGAGAGGQWSSLGGEEDGAGMDEEAEAELYLSGSLLAQAHPTGGGSAEAPSRKSSNSTSVHPYSHSQSRNAAYIPPQHSSPSSLQPSSHTRTSSSSHNQHPSHRSPSQPRVVGSEEAGFVESSSGFFGSSTVESGISSASSSYSNSIGHGPMYGYAAGSRSQAQATPRMPQVLRAQRPPHAASPSDFQSGSFVLSRMPLQHDTMQAQKEQQRLEVQRSNAQTQQTPPAGSMQ